MSPRIPSAADVSAVQNRLIREAATATPGSPYQMRLLAGASCLAQNITPFSQVPPTAAQVDFLTTLAAQIAGWTDIRFCDGPFAGAIEVMTAGLQVEAA